MFIVKKDAIDLINGKLVTEASTIGLPPGVWPDFVGVLNEQNDGFLFGPGRKPLPDGGYIYLSKSGLELHIIND